MKKYLVRTWYNEIVEREIDSETDKMLKFWVDLGDGRRRLDRELKDSTYHKWFDTAEAAGDYIEERLQIRLKAARHEVKQLEQSLQQIHSHGHTIKSDM